MHYLEFFNHFHAAKRPAARLEIGSFTGDSLRPVNCPTVAIDPAFCLRPENTAHLKQLFQFRMESDAFFSEQDPKHFLAGEVESAFLDGMHRFEFLLRDFINTEKHCARRATVFLPDCLPLTLTMTSRDQNDVPTTGPFASWWTGDVWKVLNILEEYRPDLSVKCFDCHPTGLVMVTGLDPENTVLSEKYDEILERYLNVSLTDETLGALFKNRKIHDSTVVSTPEGAQSVFGHS